jgi:hypothetical protein
VQQIFPCRLDCIVIGRILRHRGLKFVKLDVVVV